MPNTPGRRKAAAPDAAALTWPRLLALLTQHREALFALLATHGLTPPHGHAILVIAEGPMPMRHLAEQMFCDASYITAVMDHLEQTELAERRPNPNDRRIKEVVLTEKGRRVAKAIDDAMNQPPPGFAKLSRAERDQLAQLVAKLVPESENLENPFRPSPRTTT